jgi:Na+-driven multidrug efflux pump
MAVVAVLLVLLLPRLGVLGAAFTFVANNLVGGLINGYLVINRSRSLRPAGTKGS